MYRIIDCIVLEHDLGLLALAVTTCVIGAVLNALLLLRMMNASGIRKWFQLGLSSIIGGTTIWSTHFLAMLSYDPGFDHSFEPTLTVISLVVAMVGVLAAHTALAFFKGLLRSVVSGALFGLSVAAMHYIGMMSFIIPGELLWEPSRIWASVLLGGAFGAVSHQLILSWPSRNRWFFGSVFTILAICATHFTGMTSFTILFDMGIEVPPATVSETAFGAFVMSVACVLYLVGFASFCIETNLETEALGRLSFAALHDPLTGLPNRMRLIQKIGEIGQRMDDDVLERVAVLTIDLGQFKQVNDVHGYLVGDAVLSTIASRFSSTVGGGEFIARTGGDEFVAVKSGFRRIEQVTAFAERLHALVVMPIEIDALAITVGASIGIANSVEDGRDLDEILHRSSMAMQRAKSDGDDCRIYHFNEEIDQQNHDRVLLIHDLRNALQNGEFELAYQMQNSLTSLEPVGFEALLRWNHPTRGRVSPGVFIPLAEETGAIREIGLWVLRTACVEAATWPAEYTIAVNVAPQQLVQPMFCEKVADILAETGLDAKQLELEITEASMIDDLAHTQTVMYRLKDIGVKIAMDDFGTGYSSLSMLQAFPFDKIKIDRSFVSDVHENEQRAAIVRAIMLLGVALDIPVLAEGVEVERELEFLRSENCSSVQGFYFGFPLCHSELRAVIDERDVAQAS